MRAFRANLVGGLLSLWMLVTAVVGLPVPAWAQAIPTTTAAAATIPDFDELSFSGMPAITQSGSFREGSSSRTWAEGQTPDQFLTMGDIESLQPQALTLEGISQTVGEDLGKVGLDRFSLVSRQAVKDLVKAVPSLGAVELRDLPPIATLLGKRAANIMDERTLKSGTTLVEAVKKFPALGDLPLDAIDLANFAINTLPGLSQTPLGDLPGWQNATLNEVPGLGEVPLSQFPNPLGALGGVTMRIDAVWGPEEGERQRTISGSDVMGFQVPCFVDREACASIELDDNENEGMGARGPLEGEHWVSGKYQEVEGGEGAWALINGGKEPTGRLPYGDVFKVVVWEPDEKTDTVTTALFLRACNGALGCTPYFIGPIPFLTHKVNSKMFVGTLETGASGDAPSTPTGAQKGGRMPGFNASAYGDLPFDANCLMSGVTGMTGTTSSSTMPGGSASGVDLKKLANSIAEIESRGAGGYSAVGTYVCADGGRNCGRGLGRYQFMNYNEYAAAVISKRPGGQAFLDQVQRGYQPTAADLMKYFPPEDQDRAFQSSLANNIRKAQTETDPTTGRKFTGERVIERAAQMHFGGLYSTPDAGSSDVHGRLNLRDYGKRTLATYKGGGGSAFAGGVGDVCSPYASGRPGVKGDGKSLGKYINPAAGFVTTSEFGPRRSPCAGCSSNHKGIDLATPIGTPVKAADGGRVVYAGEATGYGNVLIIDHGGGRQTRYAHLSGFTARMGDTVSQGQVVAKSGNTGVGTGAHLHFETRVNANPNEPFSGTAVNPRQYVKF